MSSAALAWIVAGGSALAGSGLVLAAVVLATDAAVEPPTAIARSVPRPAFALDARFRHGEADIGGHAVAHISAEEATFIRSVTARAAEVFEVPAELLAHDVGRATLDHRDRSGLRLAALAGAAIRDLNAPPDGETARAVKTLVGFLGADPRPFDSYLSRHTELGIAARAAHLRALHARFDSHLKSLGIAATDETLWYLALAETARGRREVWGCLEEALDLGAERLGRALADLVPTAALLTDRPFVLRAFLSTWEPAEARARAESFARELEGLEKVLRRAGDRTALAPERSRRG